MPIIIRAILNGKAHLRLRRSAKRTNTRINPSTPPELGTRALELGVESWDS